MPSSESIFLHIHDPFVFNYSNLCFIFLGALHAHFPLLSRLAASSNISHLVPANTFLPFFLSFLFLLGKRSLGF